MMKIWKEKAGDHSANMKVIGRFKTVEDASKAASQINSFLEAVQVAQDRSGQQEGEHFMKALFELLNHPPYIVTDAGIDSCEFLYPVESTGNTIEYYSDDTQIQLLVDIILCNGGKIEVFTED
jgi:hypothetical protein